MLEKKPGKNNRKRRIYKLKISELPCFYCGICCSKFQPRLSSTAAHNLADNLGISWERFLADYTDLHWPGTRSFLLRQLNSACIFLSSADQRKRTICAIHDFKPSACLEWKPGITRPECLEGLTKVWDLSVNSAGEICGSKEKIEDFKGLIREREDPV
jgi:hypothetical protein